MPVQVGVVPVLVAQMDFLTTATTHQLVAMEEQAHQVLLLVLL
jgi:hypothetical protein